MSMTEVRPIIPDLKISEKVVKVIQNYCRASQMEILDPEEPEHKIFKYIGFVPQHELHYALPKHYNMKYFSTDVVSLYEGEGENVCVFWHENVLVVMISSTEEQHEGLMPHYEDAAALLTQVGGDIPPIIYKRSNKEYDYGKNGTIHIKHYVGTSSKEGEPEIPES